MDAPTVAALFKARERREEAAAEDAALSLRPGERLCVRYFNEPVREYDLREPEMVYGHARTVFAVGDKDAGKALALDTPVPTPGGWSTMGQLAVGDFVFGADGRPARVAAATGVMLGRPCYRVTFDDRSSIVADARHLWLSHTFRYRAFLNRLRRGNPEPVEPEVVTTERMAETLTLTRGRVTYRNHLIPPAGALDLPEADLPIDPYALGVWLGDGTASRAEFVTADAGIVEMLEAGGHSVEPNASPSAAKGAARLYWIDREGPRRPGPFKAALRAAGLLNAKAVPGAYLRASRAQRLALLQGLMDTDGHADARCNMCEFSNTNRGLADAAAELVESLGWKAWRSSKVPRVSGRPDLRPARAWYVRFRPDAPVFRLRRKAARFRPSASQSSAALKRAVVSVEPVASVPVRCIEVDAGDGLFLAGRSMTPTHNSALLEALGEGHLEAGHKLIDFWGCFLEGTEVLTAAGWKDFRDINDDDLVATCSQDGRLEFQRPTARQAYWHDGEMVEIRGANSRYDLTVTLNHRMLVAGYQDRDRRRKFITAEELLASVQGAKVRYAPYRMFKNAVWSGGANPAEVALPSAGGPALKLPAGQFMRLFGWYLAEGCPHHGGFVLSLNPHDAAEQAEVQGLCSSLGLRWRSYASGQTYVRSAALHALFKPLGRAHAKYVPAWVKAYSAPLLMQLLEAARAGDGWAHRGKRFDTRFISTVSPKLADDLQEIALKCGFASDISIHKARRPVRKRDGKWITPRWPERRVSYYLGQAAPTVSRRHLSKVRRSGMVYCVTVPNGTVLVRRNGKACFTGNSVDQESMAWGRSDWVRGKKVLIVHGPTVQLQFAGAWQPDQKDANKMSFADYADYDIILSSPKFFMDEDGTRDYTSMGRFVRRLLIHRESSRPIIYTIIREAGEVIYSRIKADERQDETKAQMLSLLGQARHIGISLGLDTQRAVNVDKAFRDLADFTFFKRPRGENLPDEKQFAYRYVDLQRMLRMERSQAVVVDTTGVGETLNYCPSWHKREEDVVLPQLGVVPTFVEAPEEGKERGDYKTIGDEDHAQMMRLLQAGDGKRGPYSMNEVAEAWGVSSATPAYHVNKLHNPQVQEHGVCERCARARGEFAREVIGR